MQNYLIGEFLAITFELLVMALYERLDVVPEQVLLDSSSSLPQSLSPSQSQRMGMQRLFWHLKRSAGQVCWSGEENTTILPLTVLVQFCTK